MLLVRGGGLDGDRATLEFVHKCGERLRLGDGVLTSFLAEFFGEKIADTDANSRVGQEISGE